MDAFQMTRLFLAWSRNFEEQICHMIALCWVSHRRHAQSNLSFTQPRFWYRTIVELKWFTGIKKAKKPQYALSDNKTYLCFYLSHVIGFNTGVANLRLASYMRLFEGLFVVLDKSKYPELKRLLVELFQYSEQRTYVNHFIPL